jgi:hypothetical protein
LFVPWSFCLCRDNILFVPWPLWATVNFKYSRQNFNTHGKTLILTAKL